MNREEIELLRERHRRIRWIKRVLRPLPRRATIHRYPGLKWFAKTARKRAYLWSFRVPAVVPAFYAGSILSLLPLYGVQFSLAVAFSILFRANLPIMIGLQLVTNPVTIGPIYYLCFQIGHIFLKIFGISTPPLTMYELQLLLTNLFERNWGMGLEYMGKIWAVTSLGGAIVGTFTAAICSIIYKQAAKRAGHTYARLRELQQLRKTHIHRMDSRPSIAPVRRISRKAWRPRFRH